MNQVSTTKVCFIFRPDSNTLAEIHKLYQGLQNKFPKYIDPFKKTRLPFHVTILGGVELPLDYSETLIKAAKSQLLPFNDAIAPPEIEDVYGIQLNGGNIALRLKLKKNSYKITGDRSKNKLLAKILNIPDFDFNLPVHISVAHVNHSFEGMDKVLIPFQDEVLKINETLKGMTLTPQIWTKVKTENFWRQKE